MNLNQEISLDMFKKKKKDTEEDVTALLKTTINLVIDERPKTNWAMAVPGIILILIAALLVGKFAVLDRLKKQADAESRVVALEQQKEEGLAAIEASGELASKYYHYTWSGISEEERDQISRVWIADLIGLIGTYNIEVKSYSVNGMELGVVVSAEKLQTISRLMETLREIPIVSACSVTTAQTNEGEALTAEESRPIGKVDANIRITLSTLPEVEEKMPEGWKVGEGVNLAGYRGEYELDERTITNASDEAAEGESGETGEATDSDGNAEGENAG
ncbi:MAG: hypothetical protein J6N76_09460, partial [Lachnospiraceae bacterium]|nr:hypothetical protein [Lachnospiraceae bacterium]